MTCHLNFENVGSGWDYGLPLHFPSGSTIKPNPHQTGSEICREWKYAGVDHGLNVNETS